MKACIYNPPVTLRAELLYGGGPEVGVRPRLCKYMDIFMLRMPPWQSDRKIGPSSVTFPPS